MPTFKQRLRVILTATMIAAACGAAAGYMLGRELLLRLAETKLQQYAGRIMADGEASSAELRTMLSAVSASPHPFCSDAEIRYFRNLIFESEYSKDVGRMRDGKIACSATLGRVARPQAESRPDFTQQDGSILYKNLAPYQNSDVDAITLQLGGSYVVFVPLARMHLEPAPMHYTETAMDAPRQKSGNLLGEAPPATGAILTTEGQERLGDNLYATRCSIRFFNCVTAYTSIPEALAADRTHLGGSTVLGGLLGVLSGYFFSLLYRRNKSIEQQLRRAIRRDELRLAYQPIVSLASGRIVGAEALARWTDEHGLAVGPDVFIGIAEERGFVAAITRLVVQHALSDFGETLRGHSNFRLSINVTASDLADPGFLVMLEEALQRAKVPAQRLAIEITESSTVRQEVAMEAIQHLRQQGHSVHIDDFGTGYSSLSYLHDLSVDAIKIDRSFTQAIGTGSVVVAILPQILAMAKALKLGVIVEGIETAQQAAYFAAQAQPVLGQGWLFGRPVHAAEFHSLLAKDTSDAPIIPAAALGGNLPENQDLKFVPADVA
jgi:sensor c-di-GMP phosphodiesterase-like protein